MELRKGTLLASEDEPEKAFDNLSLTFRREPSGNSHGNYDLTQYYQSSVLRRTQFNRLTLQYTLFHAFNVCKIVLELFFC